MMLGRSNEAKARPNHSWFSFWQRLIFSITWKLHVPMLVFVIANHFKDAKVIHSNNDYNDRLSANGRKFSHHSCQSNHLIFLSASLSLGGGFLHCTDPFVFVCFSKFHFTFMNLLLRSSSQLPPMNINLLVFTDNPLGNCDESDRPPISESSGNKYWQNLPSLWFSSKRSSNHHPQEQRHHRNANAMFPHQGNCASSSPEQGASRASKECIIISLHHSTALSPSNALLRIFAPSRGFAAHCMVKFCRKQHSGLHQLHHSAALWSAPTSTAVAARIPATALGTLKAEHSKFSSEGRWIFSQILNLLQNSQKEVINGTKPVIWFLLRKYPLGLWKPFERCLTSLNVAAVRPGRVGEPFRGNQDQDSCQTFTEK